jgi:hypothetical protein
MQTAEELISQIQSKWQPTCTAVGLLYQRPFTDQPVNVVDARHYAVRLNRHDMLAWCPVTEGQWKDRGRLRLEAFNQDFELVRGVDYLSEDEIFTNLLASCRCFHGSWCYCLGGWNCEHWARLVTTGRPVSYQTAQKAFGAVRLVGGHFRNPDASWVMYEAIRDLERQPER